MKSLIFTAVLALAAPAAFAQAKAQSNEQGNVATPATAASVSATCKDGTLYKGASLSGACRGHQGVDKNASAASMTKPAQPVPNATAKATPAPAVAAATAPTASNAGKVWANASTKVYHCSGDKYFGKTKHGEYMAESDAKAKGFHASHGKTCS